MKHNYKETKYTKYLSEEEKANNQRFYYGPICYRGHPEGKRSLFNGTCLECLKIIGKKSHIKTQPSKSIKCKAFRKENIEKVLVSEAKGRAKKLGVPFSITEKDVTCPTHCPILGIELLIGNNHPKDNHPSLDRVVPNLGYVPGNVQIISNRANRIKNDSTVEELGKIYHYLLRKENE